MNSWRRRQSLRAAWNLRLWKMSPLSLLTTGVCPSRDARYRSGRYRLLPEPALLLSLSPRRENSYPTIFRSWQSMTATRCPQPSAPQWTWVTSMARTLVALLRVTSQSSDSGPRSMPALVTEPALHLQDAVDGLAVDQEAVAEAQDGPETAVAEGGVLPMSSSILVVRR